MVTDSWNRSFSSSINSVRIDFQATSKQSVFIASHAAKAPRLWFWSYILHFSVFSEPTGIASCEQVPILQKYFGLSGVREKQTQKLGYIVIHNVTWGRILISTFKYLHGNPRIKKLLLNLCLSKTAPHIEERHL